MDFFLPEDITINILSRLFVRWVLRCRSVCKAWCYLIDNPIFRTNYITHPSSLILIPDTNSGHLYLAEEDEDDSSPSQSREFNYYKIKFHFLDSPTSYLVGACNGFLCFSSEDKYYDSQSSVWVSSMWVCNPVTQEFPMLPKIILPETRRTDTAYRFGFDPTTNSFKVVLSMYFSHGGQVRLNKSEARVLTLADLWSSHSSWRCLGEPPLPCIEWPFNVPPIEGPSDVFLNFSLHRLIYEYDFPDCIVSFDLKHETFGFLPCPVISTHRCSPAPLCSFFRLGLLGGCISSTDCYSVKDHCEVWIMKEYNVKKSWTKQFVIRKLGLNIVKVPNVRPISFTRNGQLLLLFYGNSLVSYNVESRTVSPLEVMPKFPNSTVILPAQLCIKSFLML